MLEVPCKLTLLWLVPGKEVHYQPLTNDTLDV